MKIKQIPFGPGRLMGSMCFGAVLAVIGGTATAFTTTGTPAVSVDGKVFALTAQTNTALSALAAADLPSATGAQFLQPSGQTGFFSHPTAASLGVASVTVYYVIGVTAAGTWKVVQGTYDNQDIGVNGYTVKGKSIIPDVPDGFTPVTVMKVVTTAAFVPGTTALTGLATFENCSVLGAHETF